MGAAQRRKGANGERELANLLADELGFDVVRNLEQVRSGGCDLIGIEPFAIEVKRCERLALTAWWSQACDQADTRIPVLAYRQSRHPWLFRLPLEFVIDGSIFGPWHRRPVCELMIEGFCLLAREVMS